MGNNIPVFDFGKDSYILRHKLNYNTSHDETWSAITFGILFTDYDLARKTQTTNAENFDPIIINDPVEDVHSFKMTYYDQEYTLGLFNVVTDTYTVTSGTTFDNGATFVNDRRYQAFHLSSTASYEVNDDLNIYFHEIISGTTGTTTWEHTGPAGEVWVATGNTESGIPWQVTGITTENGHSTGTAIWGLDGSVTDYHPILKYRVKILDVVTGSTSHIKVERKLEDYIYNNLMKIAQNSNYELLCYTIESLKWSDQSYYGIKYIMEETKWGNYFSISATTDQLIIQPIANKEDLYFDYDNIEFTLLLSGGTEVKYSFFTDGLYTKYKLDRFLGQLGYDSGRTVYFDNFTTTTSDPYVNSLEFDIVLDNIDDAQYFMPYTYIYVTGITNSTLVQHICLLTKISGTTFTIIPARVTMVTDEILVSINNMFTIHDISKMLYECYINIENDVLNTDFYIGNYFDPMMDGPDVIDARQTDFVYPNPPFPTPESNWYWLFDPGQTT